MYGVPADLPLASFVEATLIQVAIGQYQMQFIFDSSGIISIEGKWELRDESGNIIDSSAPHGERDCYRVHRIIGQTVSAYEIDPPRLFALRFANDCLLSVYDDSDQYESFSIHPGHIFV
jgi:hypothetical protein